MKALRPAADRLGLRSSTARRGKPLRKRRQGRRGKPWRLLRVPSLATRKRPRHGRHAEAARVRTADRGVGKGAHAGPVEVLALGYELGCLFVAIGLLQALVLSLRIADGFSQHLA
jgi:hypothetical protein